jgi:hypothetical protein
MYVGKCMCINIIIKIITIIMLMHDIHIPPKSFLSKSSSGLQNGLSCNVQRENPVLVLLEVQTKQPEMAMLVSLY